MDSATDDLAGSQDLRRYFRLEFPGDERVAARALRAPAARRPRSRTWRQSLHAVAHRAAAIFL